MQQFPYLSTAYTILDDYFSERPDVLVAGDGYLCRNTRDRSGWVVPDCVIAFGVHPGAIMDRNGYVIDEVGKPPDFVLEVASKTTGRVDYTTKRGIYAAYGVGEYWRFDATGGERHDAPLSAEQLVDGVYESMPLSRGQSGVIRGRSPVLGLELHWDDGRLHFYDPDAREYLPGFAEVRAQRDSAIRERDSAIYERDAAEDRAARAEAELLRLRDQIHRLKSE